MFLLSVFVAVLGASQAAISVTIYDDNCTLVDGLSGTITDHINAKTEERCWIIEVPEYSSVVLNLKMDFESSSHNGLEIIKIETEEKKTITKGYTILDKYVYSSNVKIVHFARNDGNVWWSKFVLNYKIIRGVSAVEGVEESLKNAVSWLNNQRTLFWGWKEETPRAVVALYLADAMNFSGSALKEELIAKETDVRTSVTLLKNSITPNELSLIINALLVTCHNPHRFYGNDLVARLRKAVETNRNFNHPIAYLALCNAGVKWPARAIDELERVLGHNSNYHFVKDIQAMAVMALSCMLNRGENFTETSNTSTLFDDAIQSFKTSQLEDGSFGNAHSTALITQALLASGQELSRDWNIAGAIKYLMKIMGSNIEFLTAYLTLPILNAKSLADISKVDCSASLRKHGDDTVSEIHDTFGKKINVKYSLYFGDDKEIIHTISLKVPENSTAYEVMERAAIQDPKFKFWEKSIFGKKYVYKIANLSNDPENGKFWLLHLWSTRMDMEPVTKSPDEQIMKNGQQLIMWYKTIHI